MSTGAGMRVIGLDGLERLIGVLRGQGRTVVGPTVADGAIVYDEIADLAPLPAGWEDEQAPGHYRLRRRDDGALFAFTVGPQAWKRFLSPPEQLLWRARKTADGFLCEEGDAPAPRHAFLGVRACELAAIAIQDRVYLEQEHPDPVYAARRADLFLVAVNCTRAGGTCFCTSMGTGPRATAGFDLALTERCDRDRHDFLVEVGSDAGAEVLAALEFDGLVADASAADARAVDDAVGACAASMGRTMPTDGLAAALVADYEHPRWDEVAERCLACANCTMVCPTCFCSDVVDTGDLSGEIAERWRNWGSCFEQDFTYIHGGSVRDSIRSRYRQWLTHKLSTWFEQFGTSGCVGCGRCITWCPVGIDITEEAAAIAAPAEGGT